jgi:hypothetical protein
MIVRPHSFFTKIIELHQVQVVLEERFQGDGLLSEYFKDVWRIKGA